MRFMASILLLGLMALGLRGDDQPKPEHLKYVILDQQPDSARKSTEPAIVVVRTRGEYESEAALVNKGKALYEAPPYDMNSIYLFVLAGQCPHKPGPLIEVKSIQLEKHPSPDRKKDRVVVEVTIYQPRGDRELDNPRSPWILIKLPDNRPEAVRYVLQYTKTVKESSSVLE